MNEVGSVGLLGSWFFNCATSKFRNVWVLSSWLRPPVADAALVALDELLLWLALEPDVGTTKDMASP